MGVHYLLEAIQQLFIPVNMFALVISVFFGLIVGMLPGLTATMAIALLTGLTYKIAPQAAIISLIGVYVGSISGGCQSAVLLNIPGTPASAATAVDGYALSKKGEGGLAIFLSTTSSAIGTLLSVIFVLFLTPPLTAVALKFGSWEFFLLALFGVIICSNLTSQGDALKGWISGALGLLVSLIGLDGINAYPRFSFGNINLMGGIALIPVMIGLFGFPEIVNAFKKDQQVFSSVSKLEMRRGFKLIFKNFKTVIRSAFIGVGVGIIPGVGEDVGGWLSYWGAKRASKNKALFGKGAHEGVIASETGNNSCIGGAIIPVLSLAVPGSAPAAVLLAAFWLRGYRPGPLLMTETPDFIFKICVYLAASSLIMWVLGLLISRVTVNVLSISKKILMPVIYVICAVGSYAISGNLFDIWLMFIFGIIGTILVNTKYPTAPFLLGVILGPMADSNLRRALTISNGSISGFFTRPISLFFVIVIAFLILSQFSFFNNFVSKFKRKATNVTQ